MYLISPFKKQYKANLHCHSTLSDGEKTPQELKEMYKSEGYSILAITDHECPKSHAYLDDEDFLTITGYEAHIRENPDFDVYQKEIHINLFAREKENNTLICYNPEFCFFLPEKELKMCKKAGSQKKREYSVSYVNEFLKTAKENGYIASHNHPKWSLEDESDIFLYDGFFSMEMFNYNSHLLTHLEYNGALYDKLLLRGKRLFCHSADDNHNHFPKDSLAFDSFGGFTMIYPENFTYDSVFSAMEKGEMYSSMGPVFKEIRMEKNKIHIECSEVECIMVYTGSKAPRRAFAPVGGVITEADFEIDKRAKFVRVSCVDKYGKFADTRGFLRDELDF